MVMNSFSFAYLENSLSLLQFWMTALPSRVFLVELFSARWIYYAFFFWSAEFLLKNMLIVYQAYLSKGSLSKGFHVLNKYFPLLLVRFSSLCLTFDCFIIMRLGVGFLYSFFFLELSGILGMECFFFQVREVFSHYFLDKLSAPFSLYHPSGTPHNAYTGMFDAIS